MKIKLLQYIFIINCVIFSFLILGQFKQVIISKNHHGSKVIDKMPLVIGDPFEANAVNAKPIAQRSVQFRKYLSASVKIVVSRASGSGTIVYYNKKDNIAYIQTCGHLWNGNMSSAEGKKRSKKCKVVVWYHNNKKLKDPKYYSAKVIYHSNDRSKDVALLSFNPDWEPNYFPIAPNNYKIEKDDKLHSLGCDNGSEVAHYSVRVLGYNNSSDLVTTENSPRPGRSGGGLMTTNGYFVGVCWGTSDYSGNGTGYFTPSKTIRKINEENGYGWINETTNYARKLPIIDKNNPQGEYPEGYIPIPKAA